MQYNVVMEYIQGGSIADRLRRGGAMDLEDAKKVTRDVLSGLHYLHKNCIIHRDLKPANVLISDSTYKITDFGISTQVLELQSIARSCVGTPWYMAPEVIMQEPYSYSVDIWSLGCLVLELVTGVRPYAEAGATKALQLMVTFDNPLEYRAGMEAGMSGELVDFLRKCWRRPYSMRPSAQELMEHPFLGGN